MTDLISAHGLVKIYRSRKSEVRALDGVDLAVPEGTVLGLLGPNGAGKTTTVRSRSSSRRRPSRLRGSRPVVGFLALTGHASVAEPAPDEPTAGRAA